MKSKISQFLLIFCGLIQAGLSAYPAPPNAVKSETFSLGIDGASVPVMKYMDYHYAHFSFTGSIKLVVTVPDAIRGFTISPRSLGIQGTASGNTLGFTLDQVSDTNRTPDYLVVQINGLGKLVLLGDLPETNPPDPRGAGVFNVLDKPYSADATGMQSSQDAIQRAIDDASKAGGGTVYVPLGLYRVKENLTLKDRVDFYLAPGSVLKAISDRNQYGPDIEPVLLITGKNVTVRGRGEVDASGLTLMKPNPGMTSGSTEHPRRRIIRSDGARDLAIRGIVAKDATGWSLELANSDRLLVQNVKVLNHKDVKYKIENDGIDIVLSSHALVNQCFVMTIDDAMCSKARGKGGMSDVRFTNNVLYGWSAGIKAGMQAESDMKNILFRNNDVVHARRGIGVDTRTGTSPITGVVFADTRVEETEPTIAGGDYCVDFLSQTGPIRDITISNLDCLPKKGLNFSGSHEIKNIEFIGLVINGKRILAQESAPVSKGKDVDLGLVFSPAAGLTGRKSAPDILGREVYGIFDVTGRKQEEGKAGSGRYLIRPGP
jgi:hypothetical protein